MRKNDQVNVGQDTFLDVVANLVGILIILVVVIGAQATTAWQNSTGNEDGQEQFAQLEQQVSKKAQEFESLRLENQELKRKLAEEDAINEQLATLRHRILVDLEHQRRAIDERKSSLSAVQQAKLVTSEKVEELKSKIRQVQYESRAVAQNLTPKIETIEHYPTPIAKTVFSDEIHFRVKGGRIAYVPLDELVGLMKSDWRTNAERIRRAKNTSGEVGPVHQFKLRYETEADYEPISGKPISVSMRRFFLKPIHELIGEEIAQAISDNSAFHRRIARLAPRKTTISLWVYPDGYEDLERLQYWLRRNGFQTACWPLKYDGLISGGPQGFRTTTN